MGELSSAIYSGRLSHARLSPRRHGFQMPLYMLYLDLDELEQVDRVSPLLSVERPNLMSVRRADYLGPAERDLATCVRDAVESELGVRPLGSVRMLTHVRSFGYVFNPLTLYYCFDAAPPGGEGSLRAVVAEITNTPWGERHRYVLAARGERGLTAEFDKRFHVSPFMGMQQRYHWALTAPAEQLRVHMQNREHGSRLFDASLTLKREALTRAGLHRVALRRPAMTLRVHAAIYAHALALLLKGVPFHRHPRKSLPLGADTRLP